MREYLARLLGHGLEGRVVSHVLPIFHGAGANWKSTVTTASTSALGDYPAPADHELLTARTFDAHPTGTTDLFGPRLAGSTNPTTAAGWPKAPSSGSPEATGSRPGGCAKTSGGSTLRTLS
jgi:hypothetical protein